LVRERGNKVLEQTRAEAYGLPRDLDIGWLESGRQYVEDHWETIGLTLAEFCPEIADTSKVSNCILLAGLARAIIVVMTVAYYRGRMDTDSLQKLEQLWK
jgi:hypothetical protein